jgi:hypothetical protein
METCFLNEDEEDRFQLFEQGQDGDAEPWSVFIELDGVNETLSVAVAGPYDVYRGIYKKRFYLRHTPTARSANWILRSLVPFAEAALDEFDTKWDDEPYYGHERYPALEEFEAEFHRLSDDEGGYSIVVFDAESDGLVAQ